MEKPKRRTPKFAKLLLELCGADVWNLLAGNTDEIQVVDAGFGALVKRFTEEEQQDWLNVDKNWDEWTGATLTASRKRILMTHWYGRGYERACESYDFTKVFDSCGSNLTADGSGDSEIHLQGLAEFSFELADAQRDPLTGESEAEAAGIVIEEGNAAAENAANANDSDGSDVEEELSENDGSESGDGGETSDDEDGEPFADDMYTIANAPKDRKECIGKTIAYRWEEGWYVGKVQRQVQNCEVQSRNGQFACKYSDSHREIFHDLFLEDYGAKKMWVMVTEK